MLFEMIHAQAPFYQHLEKYNFEIGHREGESKLVIYTHMYKHYIPV